MDVKGVYRVELIFPVQSQVNWITVKILIVIRIRYIFWMRYIIMFLPSLKVTGNLSKQFSKFSYYCFNMRVWYSIADSLQPLKSL